MNLEEKLHIIKRNLQEVTDEGILCKILEKRPLKIYWGTAITGCPHIGYFLPAMKIRDFVRAGCVVKILLADIHGFLDNLKAPIEKVEVRMEYYEKLLVAIFKSLGVDKDALIFIKGSDYQFSQKYTFDLYKMSSLTTVHDCMRAGTQVVKQSENPLLSSLIYPNMQALYEEYLDVDAQFGGIDQRKIFMHAAKYMPKLKYKKRIYLMNPMMPGLNSEKMSSSDEIGKIDLLDTRATIHKKISKCFCEPGNVNTGVLALFKHVVYPLENYNVCICDVVYKTYEELEQAFASNGIHPGDLKATCADLMDRIVGPVREAMSSETELIKKAYN